MKRAWKKLRYWLEYFALTASAKIIVLLPRPALVALARAFGTMAAALDRPGRRVALANLDAAFGDRYSSSEKRRLVRESYQHFTQTMLDLMWSPRLTRENFSDYIEIERLSQLANNNQPGAIIACFHYSNFEWLSLACGFQDRVGTIIAQEFKNPLLDPIFRRWRQQTGHSFIARRGGILRLFKVLRRGGNTAMLVDLTVPAGTSAVAICCFGMQKSVTPAHAWLYQRAGARIFPAHCEPLARGRYRVVLHPALKLGTNATLREIAQACWDSFEPVVRQNPAPWLWMYKHWRYRPMTDARKYPFYSGAHPRFQRMTEQR